MFRRLVFFSLIFSVVLVILVAEFFTSSKAAFTTPLTINFTYPLAIRQTSPDLIQIAGSGVQQVYRLGSVAPTGIFAGLDPKAGTSPTGTMLNFTYQNSATIGANDFVYAFRIRNDAISTVQLQTIVLGTCGNVTSIGYLKDSSGIFINPIATNFSIGNNIAALFDVSPGKETAIIFYTSPEPPVLVDTSISSGTGGRTTSSNILEQIYGACPVDLMADIKAGCTAATVSDGAVTAITGSTIYYEVVVKNPSSVTLNNLVITDLSTNTNINSQFIIGTSTPFTGTLTAGKMAKATFSEVVNSSGSKKIVVTGEYIIPNQDGTPSLQTFPLPGFNSILTDSIDLTVVEPPMLTSSFTISPANFTTLPQTLTYTLKATNTGSSSLSTTFDLDAKLKALLTSPPAGLVVSPPVSFPSVAQTITAGNMATQQFTITANTLAAWQALADVLDPKKSSSTMTVNASIAGLSSAVCGTASIRQTVPASTTFTPPCQLDALKTVACDLGAGTPPDSNFSATAIVVKNAQVYYRYKVTNSSLLDTINNISITDPLLSSTVAIGTLVPGEMKTVDVLATVPATIPSNLTISVNGICAQGTVTNTATSGLTIADPTISASKTVNGSVDLTGYTPGTELVWSLTATNNASSGVPLNLKIDDPLLRGISGVVFKRGNTIVTLPYTANAVQPGSSVTLTAAVTFNTADEFKAVAGTDQILRNTVNVTGDNVAEICGAISGALLATAQSTIRLFTPPTTEVCIVRTCEPNCPPISAGSEAAMKAPFSDDKPGSLLLYNLYTSSSTGDAAQNTRLSLTNLGPSTTFAHLFFIDGTSCNVSDTFACLSPNQTTSFLASEIDPGVTGYVVALAVNEEGCPVSFNYLIGSSHVKFASGHSAQLNAQAVAALYTGVLNGCTSNISETVIKLDGIDYGQAPATLVANTIFSQADQQSTLLIVNPVGGNFNTSDSVNTIGTLSGQVFDESEKGFSFVAPVNRCQLQATMNDSFPRIPTRLSKVISSGKVGMMRFATNDKAPIAGAIITFNPDVKLNASGFNQGHNLHFSALTNKASYTIPIFRPHI